MRRADAQRQAALAETLAHLSPRPDTDLLAELTLGVALGLHQWQPAFDAVLRARVAVEWMRRILGLDAQLSAGPAGPRLRFA